MSTRQRQIFDNGARRCDIESIVILLLQERGNCPMFVSDVYDNIGAAGGIGATYRQVANVLEQMAGAGKLVQATIGGDYIYRLPGDYIEPQLS